MKLFSIVVLWAIVPSLVAAELPKDAFALIRPRVQEVSRDLKEVMAKLADTQSKLAELEKSMGAGSIPKEAPVIPVKPKAAAPVEPKGKPAGDGWKWDEANQHWWREVTTPPPGSVAPILPTQRPLQRLFQNICPNGLCPPRQ